jgi:hypothetical protein
MPALVAGIHVLISFGTKDVDGRDKPGHDDGRGSGEQFRLSEPARRAGTSATI